MRHGCVYSVCAMLAKCRRMLIAVVSVNTDHVNSIWTRDARLTRKLGRHFLATYIRHREHCIRKAVVVCHAILSYTLYV